jgi:uncharacterized protein YbaA (DUF1428 family)
VPYVDGFVLPMPKKNLKAYQRMARDAGKVWMEHGALQYWECSADHQDEKMGRSFQKGIKSKAGETVVFAWIVYKSRAHRNRVNAKVMKDPRMNEMPKTMPFDVKRMLFGGFKILVHF